MEAVKIDNLSEMLKGVLEGIILQIIANGEVYGYEIVKKLTAQGLENTAEGTVYTVLLRIEKNGYVDIIKRPSELGPTRKFYTLNAKGISELKLFWERWDFLSGTLKNLKEG